MSKKLYKITMVSEIDTIVAAENPQQALEVAEQHRWHIEDQALQEKPRVLPFINAVAVDSMDDIPKSWDEDCVPYENKKALRSDRTITEYLFGDSDE